MPVASNASGPAAGVLVNVCRQYTRADWQWVAMKAAFGESTARDIRDKKAWIVGTGAKFSVNRPIVHAVYDYYGTLYKQNPSKCVWAGLGRVAGGPFFWGFDFIDSWIRSIEADPCYGVPDTTIKAILCAVTSGGAGFGAPSPTPGVPDPAVVQSLNFMIHTMLQTSIESLMQMGRNIFEDLAWQHEAYLAGGLSEILRLGGQPGVFDPQKDLQDACIDAWRSIDGDASGALRGNCALFQREQLHTIPPGYKALSSLLGVPMVMSFLANSPHPWGKSFFDYWGTTDVKVPPWGGDPNTALPQGQWFINRVLDHAVTDDRDRWSWMQNNIYPTWMGVSEAQRATMVGLSLEDLCAKKWPPGL